VKRNKIIWIASILVAAAVILAGCAPAEEEVKTVIIGVTDEISSLDFSDAYSTHDWELMRNVNVPLTDFVPGTAEIAEGIAESWESSADGLTWTFHLSDGWKYPDGSELVAADVVRTVERALALDGDIHGVVEGYIAGISAPDDRTVVVDLVNPRGDFPQIASMAFTMPTQEGVFPTDELVFFPEEGIVGVGPWQMVEYDPAEQVVLERNPNYKKGFVDDAPDRVIVRYFEDATSMALAVENGDIDVSWRILGPPEVQRLSTVEGLTAVNTGGGGIRYLVLNEAREPMNDKNVRQALAYLLDRDEIVDRVMQGTVDPLYSMVPPGFLAAGEYFVDRYGAGANVSAAEDVLRLSGYSEDNPLVFDLWYPPEHYGTHAAQIFQVLEAQFEATPLIQVNLQTQEWGTYVKACTADEYQACYLGWFFDYPDSSNYLDVFAESAQSDDMGIFYASEAMDDLLHAGGAETDPTVRESLYTDAQELYAEDVVTIPMHMEAEYAVFRNETVSSITIGPALVFDYELIVMK
jgi:peptide/nickel transport system substrate-binding protein